MTVCVSAPSLLNPRHSPSRSPRVAQFPSRSPSRLPRGFTLIELLVVVTIITILIALLVPAIAKSRGRANTVKCAATLHAAATSITAYAAEFNGQVSSYNTLIDFIRRGTVSNGTAAMSLNQTYQLNSCPLTHDASLYPTDPNLNYDAAYLPYANCSIVQPVLLQNISTPSLTAYAADGAGSPLYPPIPPLRVPGSLTPPSHSVGPKNVNIEPNFHGRHNGSGNVLWVDGHVSLEAAYLPPQGDPNFNSKFQKWAYTFNIGFLTPATRGTSWASFASMGSQYQDQYFLVQR